jgi:hypothetical protein
MISTIDVPGLLADSPAPQCSDRYKFVSTQNIVDRLDSWGWHPREAFYKKTRKTSPLHARHCIRFTNETLFGTDNIRPEIAVFNSHDGKSSLEMMSAIFRMICSNGMVIKEADFQEFIIPHRGYKAGDKYINHAIERLTDQATFAERLSEEWAQKITSGDIRNAYYKDALKIRFPDYMPGEHWIFDIAKREADQRPDLWTVFNRCQEHIINGGFMVTHGAGKKPRMARELTNIDRINDINRSLWSLTSSYAINHAMN